MVRQAHQEISLKDLLEAGAHFGHQVRRWNPKIAPYLYGEREGIHIFDLAKTRDALIRACDAVKKVASEEGVILFVGTKRQAQEPIKSVAIKVGMPYINQRWIGGLFTNFKQIAKSIEKLKEMKAKRDVGEYKEYTKREQLLLDREIARLERVFGGIANLEELPDMVFIVDTNKEETAVLEAMRMEIPTVGIVDSNSNPEQIDFPIPMNDDATTAVELVVNLIGDSIKKGQGKKKKDEKD